MASISRLRDADLLVHNRQVGIPKLNIHNRLQEPKIAKDQFGKSGETLLQHSLGIKASFLQVHKIVHIFGSTPLLIQLISGIFQTDYIFED